MPQVSAPYPLPAGLDGDWYDSNFFKDSITLVNADPQAVQISTLTVSAATNDKTYTVYIQNIPVSFTADGSATTAEIATGLGAAIEAESALAFIDVSVASNVVTLTGRQEGLVFTLVENDAQLAFATSQSAADAAVVNFGRFIVRAADASDGTKQGRLINGTDLDGASATLSFTADNSQPYSGTITIDGVGYDFTFTSDGSATANEIATGLKAAIDALSLDVTTALDTDDLVITGDEGVNFVLSNLAAGGAGAISLDAYSAASTLSECLVAVRSDARTQTSSGIVNGYAPNSNMAAGRKGRVRVPTEALVSAGDPVYVRYAADGSLDQLGVFSNAAGTGLVRIDNLFNVSWYEGSSQQQGVLQLG